MAHALIRLKVQAEKSRLYHTDVIERGVLSGDLADRWSVLPRAAMRSCSQQPCQSYAVVGPATPSALAMCRDVVSAGSKPFTQPSFIEASRSEGSFSWV